MFKRSQSSNVDRFWRWFLKADLREVDSDALLERLLPELQKIHEYLAAEVTPAGIQPRELVISADGMVEAVGAVELLVDRAPEMRDWKITRFRPALSNYIDLSIRTDEGLIDPSALLYIYEADQPQSRIDIFCDWYTEPGPGDGLVYMLLDMAIGEYNVMCAVDIVFVYPLEQAPASARPWSELQREFVK